MSWTLANSSHPPNRILKRPADLAETGFFYDARFNGTADLTEANTIRTAIPALFDQSNVFRTWIAIKRLFPLIGAWVEEDPDTEIVSFVVSEARLNTVRSEEIQFGSFSSRNDEWLFEEFLHNGERQLSDGLLARLFIYSRDDDPECFHVIFYYAHPIIDGISGMTLIRTFFDILCLPPSDSVPDLVERLALVLGSQNLDPNPHLPIARRRWRRAAGKIMRQIRNAKQQGGTTLPRKMTNHTIFTPAKSRRVWTSLSPEMSARIIASCRRTKVTLGQACFVLAQIASSRLLHRRYFRGEITEEEWQWRKRQPHNCHCHINLRPYLDKRWFDNGGATVVMLAVHFLRIRLPFMPAVSYPRSEQSLFPTDKGAPPFSALLSHGRFFLRCNLVKDQSITYLNHPLLFELVDALLPSLMPVRKAAGRHWHQNQGSEFKDAEVPVSSTMTDTFISHNSGSSLGLLDDIRPAEYPLPQSHPFSSRRMHMDANVRKSSQSEFELSSSPSKPYLCGQKPLLHVVETSSRLRCRPAELYFGTSTKQNELGLWVTWDANVYEESMVHEWLDEIRAATEWYLGSEEQIQTKL